jgi:hypothetical protein
MDEKMREATSAAPWLKQASAFTTHHWDSAATLEEANLEAVLFLQSTQ